MGKGGEWHGERGKEWKEIEKREGETVECELSIDWQQIQNNLISSSPLLSLSPFLSSALSFFSSSTALPLSILTSLASQALMQQFCQFWPAHLASTWQLTDAIDRYQSIVQLPDNYAGSCSRVHQMPPVKWSPPSNAECLIRILFPTPCPTSGGARQQFVTYLAWYVACVAWSKERDPLLLLLPPKLLHVLKKTLNQRSKTPRVEFAVIDKRVYRFGNRNNCECL